MEGSEEYAGMCELQVSKAGAGTPGSTHAGQEVECAATPAPDPWTSCTPESVRGCYPALQYDLDRQSSRLLGVKKTSQMPHGRGQQPERVGESCLDSTAVSLCPISRAGDHR